MAQAKHGEDTHHSEKNTSHQNETHKNASHESTGTQGHVKDPQHDGRLKENRDKGVSLGSTEHSAKQPHAAGKD